jgi:hypothetical protein
VVDALGEMECCDGFQSSNVVGSCVAKVRFGLSRARSPTRRLNSQHYLVQQTTSIRIVQCEERTYKRGSTGVYCLLIWDQIVSDGPGCLVKPTQTIVNARPINTNKCTQCDRSAYAHPPKNHIVHYFLSLYWLEGWRAPRPGLYHSPPPAS